MLEFPNKARLEKGPVAIIDCPEDIPCDPCVECCKFDAITKATINSLPQINYDKCVGCGICVAKCPGLAIFVVDFTYSDEEALVILPHEFILPAVGSEILVYNRDGKAISKCKIIKSYILYNTGIVSVTVNKKYALDAVSIGKPF